ncbi:hypothetical protein DPEC_G00237680 [Dallia pectoralis]|uniref:Uncharacterized protein n=1 Tax=Dallia pectoralis TaxID=75939 RepID=A0ACC2FZ01_DALPE|nr:hypothetical protein DPEC_G00237680 [Dallia pectoralis]
MTSPVKSSIDKTVECLGVSEEPIEEICSSTETDHISLSSISDCVSEISLPAEPQPNIALRPSMDGKQTPMLFTDQPSWLPERTNTQVEILRRIRENLAYMDLILGEWLEPQEEPEKSIGWITRWLSNKKGNRVSNTVGMDQKTGPVKSGTRTDMKGIQQDRLDKLNEVFRVCSERLAELNQQVQGIPTCSSPDSPEKITVQRFVSNSYRVFIELGHTFMYCPDRH